MDQLRLIVAFLVVACTVAVGASVLAQSGPITPYGVAIGAEAEEPISSDRPRSPGRDDSPPEAARPRSDVGQAAAESGRWGQFRGRVIFNGPPPAARVVADPDERIARRDHRGGLIADVPPRRLPDYEVIARRGEPIRSERLLTDPETRGVRNALVYIVKPSAVRDEARLAAQKTIRFRADRGVFVPHVLAAIQGAEILVSTDDLAVYQVRSQLPGTEFLVEENDTRLERPRVQSRDGMNFLFGNFRDRRQVSLRVRPKAGKPRPMPIGEDIHVWMSAWWLILDHPYFAVTDERGAFEIRDAPAGPQQVRVWQESVDPLGKVFEGEVVIRGDGETVKNYVIEPAKVRLD